MTLSELLIKILTHFFLIISCHFISYGSQTNPLIIIKDLNKATEENNAAVILMDKSNAFD